VPLGFHIIFLYSINHEFIILQKKIMSISIQWIASYIVIYVGSVFLKLKKLLIPDIRDVYMLAFTNSLPHSALKLLLGKMMQVPKFQHLNKFCVKREVKLRSHGPCEPDVRRLRKIMLFRRNCIFRENWILRSLRFTEYI
jgi:hypothetical protein